MNCPIHLEAIALDREEAVALPCGHVFCLSCITKCLDAVKPKKSCPCPICKRPLTQKNVLRLFLDPRSPNSSPTKSRAVGHLSATEKRRAHALHLNLKNFEVDESAGNVEQACAGMDRFAEGVAGTSMDIEAKCLSEEIKAAASRFETLILPELRELTSIRTRTSDLEEETARLKATLHQREKEVDANNRRRKALEKDLDNLQKLKRIADDKASSLREALTVTSEKLVDAESAIRARDETIREKDDRLTQFKKWLADHKSKVETYRNKIRELERHLEELPSSSIYPNEYPRERPRAGSSSRTAAGTLDLDDGQGDSEPPAKRRRIEHAEGLGDVQLDKSCFMKKPQSSFNIKVPKQRTAGPGLGVLNLTKGGQIKGTVVLGSRQRLGKMG